MSQPNTSNCRQCGRLAAFCDCKGEKINVLTQGSVAVLKSERDYLSARVKALKAKVAELEQAMPKYKPGDAVWPLQRSIALLGWVVVAERKIDEIHIVPGHLYYQFNLGHTTITYKEENLRPTQAEAQAECDRRNEG